MTGHRIITLAALALLATACNREVISPDEGREAIDFSASFAQDLTKAVGEKSSLANADKIGVFACHTGDIPYDLYSVSPDFMYNQEVTYNEENWTYSPVKYWPNNSPEYISFFSYYPYISSEQALASTEGGIIGFSNANAKGDPWLVYRLPEAAPYTQTDLMYGVPHLNKTKQEASEKIEFTLKHALACIADEVTVQMSDALYNKMHNDLDISFTGLKIEYSNLTTKARLVLNSAGEPNWKEVISGELLTSRTYTSGTIEGKTFSKEETTNPAAMTIDSGHGLFYIPLQLAGQPSPQAEITLSYTVTGVGNNGSFTDTAVKVIDFAPGDASKKQNLVLTLNEHFNLEADIVTETANGISMPGDLAAVDEDVEIDYTVDPVTYEFKGTGEVQTFTAPRTGTYTLEAWGAEGGSGTTVGAKGGYAKADFNLSIGDVLYIYVGGKGGDGGASTSTTHGAGGVGGWNGGRDGGASYFSDEGWRGGGGGGGATHIAVSPIGVIGILSLTKLSSYEGSEGHLLLVAGGGGGGSWATNSAGAGGGTSGIAGKNGDGVSLINWYIAGEFSYGALGGDGDSGSGCAEGNGGGGGGYVGGNAKTDINVGNHSATGGSGGSSKANTDRYNYVTGSFSTTDGERSGNGQAKITFVAKTSL